jgi:arsenate reductase
MPTTDRRTTILFLCTGNSCRSQMAEGWTRHLHSEVIEAYSAGTEKHGLNPLAVRVMAEAGVDISGQRSKTVAELPIREVDIVITLCGHAEAHCPYFPAKTKVIHQRFDDPPELARNAATKEEALSHYRRVRDAISAYIRSLPETLQKTE